MQTLWKAWLLIAVLVIPAVAWAVLAGVGWDVWRGDGAAPADTR